MEFWIRSLISLTVFGAASTNLAAADDQPSSRRITIVNPKLLAADDVPAVRTPLGLPNDYKPWIVQLKSGQLLIAGFCYGSTPSNELPKGEPYFERAIFWRSPDGGHTCRKREERSDIHGREFALTCLTDGTLIMPCHFLANDAANIAGYTYSKIFRSTDEGKTWTEQRVGPNDFPDVRVIHTADAPHAVISRRKAERRPRLGQRGWKGSSPAKASRRAVDSWRSARCSR